MLRDFSRNRAPFLEIWSTYLIFTYLQLFILLQTFLDSDLAVGKQSKAKCAQNVNEGTMMLMLCLPLKVSAFCVIDSAALNSDENCAM